ncbi:MAG: sodium:proton antiporter [Bacteroidetes bacterium CG18_big_fil_WC_8_21_14_2_50_41_14]|nr:MAG: sodium:proton antiporter [Bacteroidetes bacterium CG18_big_fil_WC_8_21_14_2_50_41_14]
MRLRMIKTLRIILFLLAFGLTINCVQAESSSISTPDFQLELPDIVVSGITQDILITVNEHFIPLAADSVVLTLNGKTEYYLISGNIIRVPYAFSKKEELTIGMANVEKTVPVSPIPLWMSILPPLFAILFALLLREVYSALIIGLWVGTGIIFYYKGATFFVAVFQGFLSIIDTYIVESLNDRGHLSIILFSMIIAATVSVITKNGGMKGVVNQLSRFVTGPRSASFITWLLGIMIFFDDYANTLVVGNTMRPLTDKMKVSREKLAYLIDSTAAPVASIAFVTTWIGAELSYIQDGINQLNLDESAYGVFFHSLAYSFYPVFTLIFILIIIWKDVDYGPMLKAERRARGTSEEQGDYTIDEQFNKDMQEEIQAKPGIKSRSFNAIIPVLVIIIGTLSGLFYTGYRDEVWRNASLGFIDKLSETMGGADSYLALLWASSGSLMMALLLSFGQRILTIKESMESIIQGFKTMLPAVMILTLAWSIALITKHMHTADFISQSLIEASVSPFLLPLLTFIIAALISFSTGSSWGTMAILYPLMLPSAWLLSKHATLDYTTSMSIFHNIAAAVLTGSVFGDHCSPISDTTILSSLASSCPHIEHVRTQLPYAMTVGFVAMVIGTLPSSFGINPVFLFIIGILLLYLIIQKFGKPSRILT